MKIRAFALQIFLGDGQGVRSVANQRCAPLPTVQTVAKIVMVRRKRSHGSPQARCLSSEEGAFRTPTSADPLTEKAEALNKHAHLFPERSAGSAEKANALSEEMLLHGRPVATRADIGWNSRGEEKTELDRNFSNARSGDTTTPGRAAKHKIRRASPTGSPGN